MGHPVELTMSQNCFMQLLFKQFFKFSILKVLHTSAAPCIIFCTVFPTISYFSILALLFRYCGIHYNNLNSVLDTIETSFVQMYGVNDQPPEIAVSNNSAPLVLHTEALKKQ